MTDRTPAEEHARQDIAEATQPREDTSRLAAKLAETKPEPKQTATEKALSDIDLASAPMTWRTLTVIAATEFVPKELRGKPDAMLAAIYMGRELGLGPMQAMNMLDVIDGKPSLSAELMNAMVRAAGHSIRIDELTPDGATITGTRADNGDTVTITFDRVAAERAGLSKRRNYQTYPEAMFLARALSTLCRFLFPDVIGSIHALTPEELGAERLPELNLADAIDAEEVTE